MLDSYAVIMAGLLLIVPGLISDAIGLLLLIPPLRRWLIRRAVGDIYDHPLVSGEGRAEVRRATVIDATFERHEPDEERSDR